MYMAATQLTNIMSAMGRKGDSVVGHLSKGDVVIPREAVMQNPEFLTKLKKVMADSNSDYRTHIVGSGYENKNPHTGAPEFNWLSNAWHGITSHPLTSIASIAAAPFTGGVSLLGLGSNALGGIEAGNPNPLAHASSTSPTAATPAPNLGAVAQPFAPKQPAAVALPSDLSNLSPGGQAFGTLSPIQQSSYLGTQGSQGSGLSGDDKNYYLNLLQRNLIDENGNMQNINSALQPIDRNYASSQGLPTGNTNDFLQALQQPAAVS